MTVAPRTPGSDPVTLVLLPGLDGTDVFFRPLVASLPGWVRPLMVCFPASGASDYPALLSFVRDAVSQIPQCYVLGWSFSGPLALMLAGAEPKKVQGVILCASFVCPPRPIYRRMGGLAVTPVIWTIRAGRRLPIWMGRGMTDAFRRDKTETWNRVSAGVVAARVRTILRVDAREHLRRCLPPVLYLAGSHDGVVPYRNVQEIVRIRPSARVRTIAGRHFALYTNPAAAAQAIAGFIDSADGS